MRWEKQAIDPTEVRAVAARHGIDLISASILLRRGVTAAREIRCVLESETGLLHNPFEFVEMEEAVDRINEAIDGGERIFVFGDRDVDGITSTALLVESLGELGAQVEWGVPLGDDSYGLRADTVERVRASGAKLLITVDCGVSSVAEISAAAEAGIDTIVVDHHLPHGEVPVVRAMLNPRMEDSGYPFEHLSACTVAAKLSWALRFSSTDFYGQPFVLLNVRPVNEAYRIEAVRMLNLVEQERLLETHVPGLSRAEASGLDAFISGCGVVVYDLEAAARLLARCFGRPVDLAAAGASDLVPLVAERHPELAGKSLLRIAEARRLSSDSAELDVLRDLFVQTAWERLGLLQELDARLDLVALSTLADSMPLKDENRVLVRRGLGRLAGTERVGLRELLYRKGLHGTSIDAKAVLWQITPLINASGRMGEPDRAVRLLMAREQAEAAELAGSLEDLNEKRKGVEERVWEQVLSQARESHRRSEGRFVMVADPGVSRGVTGILAARIARHFRAPALVAACLDDRIVGSLRGRVRLKSFLDTFADLFTDYGGHDFAAGFNMPVPNLPEFERRFYEAAREVEEGDEDREVIRVDAEIPPRYLTPDLFRVAERFEPYGEGNPPLVFLTRGLRVVQCEAVGKKGASHARLLLASEQHKWPAIWWEAADRLGKELVADALLDVVYRLSRNEWRGRQRLQLSILDVKR